MNIVYSTMRWWNMPLLYSHHKLCSLLSLSTSSCPSTILILIHCNLVVSFSLRIRYSSTAQFMMGVQQGHIPPSHC
jgi:hypothetical protein